jgi:glycosyltransferase involved in cell wall biosynthesis
VSARAEPKRILLVSHYYPPHLGGIENVVRQEAVRLAARGLDVCVLTTGPRGSVRTEEGVRVVRVAAWNGPERRAGVSFPVPGPGLAAAALRWTRWADAVHVHDCLYPTSWAAWAATALLRTPRLVTQHVGLVAHPSAPVRLVQQAVYATAGRGLLRGSRAVLTLNASVAAFAVSRGARPERLRHLPNGVDTDLFRAPDSAEARSGARKSFGLPAERPLVLFVGRLVPKKGYDLLLAGHHPEADYDLVFAGDGTADAAAELAGRPGVHHMGALDPERLAEAYRACDVFALPSTAEGFPLTVQEAMASGLPVVTTDDPGYAPYALDGAGVELLPRDVAALRDTLTRLVGDPSLRERMGSRARDRAERDFTWDQHVDALLGHYREAMAEGTR